METEQFERLIELNDQLQEAWNQFLGDGHYYVRLNVLLTELDRLCHELIGEDE